MTSLLCRLFAASLLLPLISLAAELPPAKKVVDPTPANKRDREVRLETARLVEARDTAGLEALAAELRTSREALTSGWWILSDFYDSAISLPDDPDEAKEMMNFYETWASNRPENITAQICLAEAYISYAWKARGSGWAKTVTVDGWKLFDQRLEKAWEVLKNAQTLAEKCPGWYGTAQTVALGQGWSHDEYMAMVNEAISKEPTYGEYYRNACYWMLPRWHGEPGEFESWIASEAEKAPPEQRDRQYARLVWWANLMPVSGEIRFGTGELDWARTKRGFEGWIAEKPDNLMLHILLTQLALLANDRATAREQFDITGGQYYPPMWKGVVQFEQARAFAYNGGPNPLLKEESPLKRSPRFTPEQIAVVKKSFAIVITFFGGLIAGLLLLTIALQRKNIAVGAGAFFACLILGTIFGTIATVLPAVALWWYFHRQPSPPDTEIKPHPGWLVLIWAIVLAGCYLGFQIVATSLAAFPLVMEAGPSKLSYVALFSDGTAMRISISAVWLCSLGLVAIVWPPTQQVWNDRLALQPCPLRLVLLWALPTAVLIAILSWTMDHFIDDRTRAALEFMAEAIASPVSFFIGVALVAPIFEELLFRGYIFGGWMGKIGPWGAAFASSLLFALCHVQYGITGLLFTFIFGLLLCLVRWKTGSLYPTIALHILNNLAYSVFVLLEARGPAA